MPPSHNRSDHGPIPSVGGSTTGPPGKQSTRTTVTVEPYAKELRQIERALPGSTHAERQRFLADRGGDVHAAIDKLGKYLEWRKKYCNDEVDQLDSCSWTYATQLALQHAARGDGRKSVNATDTVKLPCTLFIHENEQSTSNGSRDVDNATITKKRYLQLLPARIDTKLADTSVYALSLALYLDHALDRNSTEKVTLVIDVRSGHGWANIKAVHLLPFIQSTVRLLCDLHPMRLERCIVFPVPKVATVLYQGIKPFVGRDNAEKICLVSGPAGRNDRVPRSMRDYLDEELIARLEERRRGCFNR